MQQNPNISGKLNRHAAKAIQGLTLLAAVLAINAIDAAPKAAKAAAVANTGATGTIRGKVLDSANGEPMIGVTAVIKDLGLYGITDIDGNYTITNVPVGSQTITYQITGYQSASTQVQVTQGKPAIAKITMNYKVSGEVVVTAKRMDNTAAALLTKRKKAAAAQDAISAEQISKSPDSDAGEAAKRVTGITVVDGKYVYVRGLGERYSSVQFNGSTIPSPNPDKRVIPLDIFPAALLDNLVVTKTYTVDLPGEFSGGLVQINPKDYPEERELKISISSGFNTVTTGKTFYGSQGGKTDFWGIDDGTRALPSAIGDSNKKIALANTAFNPNGYSAAEMESLGESFKRTWDINKSQGIIPGGVQASFGNSYKIGETTTLGLIAAGLARETSETIADKAYKTYFSPGSPKLDYKQNISTYSTTKGGLLGLSLGFAKYHKVRVNSFYSNNTEDTVQETNGNHPDYATPIRDVRIKYNNYGLWFTQLNGEHVLPWLLDAKFTWKSSYARATFSQPDFRSYTQLTNPGAENSLLIREDSPSRVFTNHLDETVDFQPEISFPFSQWSGLKSTFSVGGFLSYRDRGSKTRRFIYTNNGAPASYLNGNINDVMSPDRTNQAIGTGFAFSEITGPNDSYRGEQIINAGYGQLDMPLITNLRMIAGARYEASQITVTTYDVFSTTSTPVKAILRNENAIPGVNLIYSITSDINLRTAFSQTVSRPDFRELTPYLFRDAAGVDVTKGNINLKQANISNYDLRLEWFPGVGEVLALSGFYKDLTNPVEITELASSDVIISYANVPKASLMGAEFEIHKNLGFISQWINEFSLFTNYSAIKSEVSLPDGGFYTNKNRPLQGQSPYVLNAGMNYDRNAWGLSVTLLYNIYGPRIIRVGAGGLDDTYEQPVGRFDAVVKKTFGAYGALKASAANILNAEYRATQGTDLRYSYYRGTTFGLSYDLKF